MADTGHVLPSAAVTASETPWEDNDWTSPGNITADDSTNASITAATYDSPDQSYVLKAYTFDFSSIPSGATIDGVECIVNCYYANGTVSIDLMQLLDTSRAKVGTNQCATPVALGTGSSGTVTKGGATDKWGNSLTDTWVKDADFGVALGFAATGANADVFVDYVSLKVWYTYTSSTKYQTIEGAITPSGALSKQTKTAKAGAITPAGLLAKQTQTAKAGAITPAGLLVKRANKAFTGALTLAGAFTWSLWEIWRKDGVGGSFAAIRQVAYGLWTWDDNISLVSGTTYYHKVRRITDGVAGEFSNITETLYSGAKEMIISGALALSGALSIQAQKRLSGGLTPAGLLTRITGKVLSGGITPSGALSKIRTAYKSLAGAITPSGALVKRAYKTFAGGITPNGAVIKRAYKTFAGAITPSGALSAIKTYMKVLDGALSMSGTLVGKALKNISGAISPSGALIKRTYKTFAGAITPSGALSATRAYLKSLVGEIIPSGALSRRTSKILDGAISPSGALSKLIKKAFSGILNLSGVVVGFWQAAEVAIRRLTLPLRNARLHINDRDNDFSLPDRSSEIELPDRDKDLTLPKRPRRLN